MVKKSDGFSAVEGVLILLIVGIIGFTGWYVMNSKKKADSSLNSATTTSQSAASGTSPLSSKTPLPASTTTKQATTISKGADDTSLNGDLNSINSSMGTASQDSNYGNGALNDSSSEISVPTN